MGSASSTTTSIDNDGNKTQTTTFTDNNGNRSKTTTYTDKDGNRALSTQDGHYVWTGSKWARDEDEGCLFWIIGLLVLLVVIVLRALCVGTVRMWRVGNIGKIIVGVYFLLIAMMITVSAVTGNDGAIAVTVVICLSYLVLCAVFTCFDFEPYEGNSTKNNEPVGREEEQRQEPVPADVAIPVKDIEDQPNDTSPEVGENTSGLTTAEVQ